MTGVFQDNVLDGAAAQIALVLLEQTAFDLEIVRHVIDGAAVTAGAVTGEVTKRNDGGGRLPKHVRRCKGKAGRI